MIEAKLALTGEVTEVVLLRSLSSATALTIIAPLVTVVKVGHDILDVLAAASADTGVRSNGVVVLTPLYATVNPLVTVPLVTATV